MKGRRACWPRRRCPAAPGLWKYRGGVDNTDRIFENLFRNFIAFAYHPVDSASIGDTMNYLLETNKKTMRFTFSRYCELGVFHKHKEKVNQARIDRALNIVNLQKIPEATVLYLAGMMPRIVLQDRLRHDVRSTRRSLPRWYDSSDTVV